MGRRTGLLVGIGMAFFSVTLSILSHMVQSIFLKYSNNQEIIQLDSYEVYALSRFLLGVAISVNMGLGAMYLVEISLVF